MQLDKSFCMAFIEAWHDVFANDVFGIAIVHPQLPPATLRRRPVDIVGLPQAAIRQGNRVFLIDVLLGPLPRRVALLCSEGTTMSDIVERLWLTEFCNRPELICSLQQELQEEIRSW